MESLAKSLGGGVSWYKDKGPQSFYDLVLEQMKGSILCASGSRLVQQLVKGLCGCRRVTWIQEET